MGIIEEFTDETGANLGAYNAAYPTFQIKPFGGGLPPNTKITITVTTYTGPSKTGSISFVSRIVFDCTTGEVLQSSPANPAVSIPTLSPVALVAMTTLLALLGTAMLRRPTRRRAARR